MTLEPMKRAGPPPAAASEKETWIEAHRGRITGSVWPACQNLGHRTALSAYQRILEPHSDDAGIAAELGLALEPWMQARYQKETGRRLRANGLTLIVHPEYPEIACTPDFFILDQADQIIGLVQAKTHGGRDWREGAPAEVEAQTYFEEAIVNAHLAAQGKPPLQVRATCALLFGPPKVFLKQDLPAEPLILDWTIREARAWHARHIVPKVPPAPTGKEVDCDSVRDLVAGMRPGATVQLGADLAQFLERAGAVSDQIKPLEEEKKRLINICKLALGEAEIGILPDGRRIKSGLVKRAAYSVEATEYRQAPKFMKG